jgi:NADPH2:quinone reductase
LCKYFGANVIGTTSTPEKAELAKANGADHVLLTTASSEDNIAAIKKLTGKGVHVVYDSVGRDTWEEDFEVVRPKATIVSFGNSSGPVPAFEPLKLFAKALKVTRPTLGPFMVEPEDFARYATEIFDIVKKGGLKVNPRSTALIAVAGLISLSDGSPQTVSNRPQFSIYKVYPFTAEGVAQTQLDITSRSTTGKLIIHVSD